MIQEKFSLASKDKQNTSSFDTLITNPRHEATDLKFTNQMPSPSGSDGWKKPNRNANTQSPL